MGIDSVSEQATVDSSGKLEDKRENGTSHCIQNPNGKPVNTECFHFDNLDGCTLPKLNRSDINWHRLKFHENLFIIILQNGYHETFSELFNLIDYEEKRRLNEGPSSSYWYIQSLIDRHQLLSEMMIHLINAENFNRSNQINEVYKENLYLAELFRSNINDAWLLGIYLQKCLNIVTNGYFTVKNMIKIKKNLNGLNNNTQFDNLNELKQSLKRSLFEAIYHNAAYFYEKASNQKLVGLCTKQISQSYQHHKEYELAYKFANQYLEIAEHSNDISEKIEACKLLGSINENLSKINEAEINYTTAVEYSHTLNDSMKLTETYELLAKFYIMNTDKHELAKLAAVNGLKYAQTNENLLYNQLKLWYSMSKARLMEEHYLNIVIAAQNNSRDIIDLIKWKDTRHDLPIFDKEHFMEVTYNSFTKTRNHINQSSSN
ncbi:Tetratricopeptide repeat protein [Schistosoma japonicum]|uniref:Tetratricopeptide repeat protein 29 n=1 Tax=Schistosoma japonicum TaxID=6182 RepID=A0A4Z2CPK6_SCHJA|nr:Tetratricopeptide repeat protein [Schistosoma japonicum]